MIRLLTHRWGWKLLSLGLAGFLWLIFIREPQLATFITAPVLMQNMPANLELSAEMVRQVQIAIEGPANRLTPEDLSDTAVVINVGSVDGPGDRTFTIEAANVELPNGVNFVRAVPSQVRFHFERRVSRMVPVRVRIASPPPDGYRVESQEVEPTQLAIVGPQSNVEQIGFVDTDTVDLGNVVGPAVFRVNTFVDDPQIRFESSPTVNVRVNVEKIPSNRKR